jgi:DNA-binding winged helix-turn-helix (wHTH) protein/tetratricopeptide (TPR) repeat protein
LSYRFGNFALDTERRELRHGLVIVRPLEPQVFDLLKYLIQNRERVVSRDDLLKAIWKGRIVSDGALSVRINAARHAIGDNGREQRLIRTLRRKGFRFVGTVYEDRADGAEAKSAPGEQRLAFSTRPALVVRPTRNIDGNREGDCLAAGIHEDLLTALSRPGWFIVLSPRPSFADKFLAADPAAVASKFSAQYALESGIRLVQDRTYISVQLVDGLSGRYLWAQRFEQFISEGLALSDKVAHRIATAVQFWIFTTEDMRANSKSPESFSAWEYVVRALSLMNSRKKQHVTAAYGLLRTAVALHPKSAQTYSLLSFITTLGVHMGWKPAQTTLPRAINIANTALGLSPDEPWAHVALGYAMLWSRDDHYTFIEIEKALALDPNFAMAHNLRAFATSILLGRGEEALAHVERAESNFDDLFARGNIGVCNNSRTSAYFVAGRYRESMKFARRAILESPSLTPAYRPYIVSCALAGELEEARAALRTLRRLMPTISMQWLKEELPYIRAEERQRYMEGFRLVGLK